MKDYSGYLRSGYGAIVIKGGMTLIEAFIRNTRGPVLMQSEKTQIGNFYEVEIAKQNRKSDNAIVVKKFL